MKESFKQIKQCSICELRCNQTPIIDISSDASVFWLGLSAVKVSDVANEIPLSSKTNSGKLILNIETICQSTLFYKTNLVKCLPLKDGKIRYPNKIEMMNCFHNLSIEIKEFQPKIIFLLGKQVSDFICNMLNVDIEKLNDDFNYSTFKLSNITYVPIHHPSYILVYKRKRMDIYIDKIVELINKEKI